MKSTTLLAIGCVLSAIPAAHGNGGGYMSGVKSTGPFRPVHVEEVAMTAEKLHITLQRGYADVSIRYTFQNAGPARKVRMGFPCAVSKSRDYSGGVSTDTHSDPDHLQRFELKLDGKKIAAEEVPDFIKLPDTAEGNHGLQDVDALEGKTITSWQVVSVDFPAGSTRTMEVAYRNPYYYTVSSMSDNSSFSEQGMIYLFSAAGLWKGPIKEGEVIIEAAGIPADQVKLSHPKRFERSGNQWTWRFRDFEPTLTDDLTIVTKPAQYRSPATREGNSRTPFYVCTGSYGTWEERLKNGSWALHTSDYTASASSTLPTDEASSYDASNLAGAQDQKFGWSEGAEGDGIGESVTLTLKQPRGIAGLEINNGYQKSPELFAANNRVKEVTVQLDDRAPFRATLGDTEEMQEISFPGGKVEARQVTLTIQSVYPGTRHKDTCLSKIALILPLSKAPKLLPSR